jgi:hypothetical protein
VSKNTRTNQIAIILAIIAGVLALSAALIKYVRFGEIDIAPIAAGIVIPAIVISTVKARGSNKR